MRTDAMASPDELYYADKIGERQGAPYRADESPKEGSRGLERARVLPKDIGGLFGRLHTYLQVVFQASKRPGR